MKKNLIVPLLVCFVWLSLFATMAKADIPDICIGGKCSSRTNNINFNPVPTPNKIDPTTFYITEGIIVVGILAATFVIIRVSRKK